MPSPQLSFGTLFALSLAESAFGTEAVRAVSMTVKSESIHKKPTNVIVEHLASYGSGPLDTVQTDAIVEGDTVVDMCYSGNALGILLMAAFGAVAEAGGPAYTHTYTVAEALSSFTGMLRRGNASIGEESYGLVAGKTVFKFDTRGPCTVTTSWQGKNAGTRGAESPAAPTLGTARHYVMGHHVGAFTFNGAAYVTKSITITIDNKIDMLKEHGSINPSDAVRGAPVDVSIDVELYKRDDVIYNAFLANTTGSWTFTCTLSSETLVFSGGKALVESHDDPIDKPGAPVVEKMKLRGMSVAATSGPITCVLTNADATYGAS